MGRGKIMTSDFNIRDEQNEVILKAYQRDNYQCVDTGLRSDICYIFFSSNGLYYPDTRKVFEEEIFQKDRYEWKWMAKNSGIYNIAGKIIFVRDIYKVWYTKGINNKSNTIDKVLELLKELTEGYRIVTVGSSAGGYMAALAAVKLKALYCINFSGQYAISKNLNNPYQDISNLMEDYKGEIFYFVPMHNESDNWQYNLVREKGCVKSFLFNEKQHAATMLTGNMSYIISKPEAKLLQLYEHYESKEIDKISFLFYTVPFYRVAGILGKELKGFIIRRMGKHYNGV